MNKNFKLANKIDLEGYTEATEWIEHNLKILDAYYENQKQQGKLKNIKHLEIGRLVALGSVMELINSSDFTCKKEYNKTITNLYRNFFAFHVIPALKDEILKTSDIRIIPVLGEIFSYPLIYTRKNPHRYDEICITGEKLEDIIPIEQVFCYNSPSIEFDISAKLEAFFFGEQHRVNKSIIFRFIESMSMDYKNHSEKEILKKEKSKKKVDKCLEVGVSYIKTVLGEDYFNQLIQETLNKMEDGNGIYIRLLNNLLPRNAIQHEVIFKGLLNQLIPYIDDNDLKNEVQLEILL